MFTTLAVVVAATFAVVVVVVAPLLPMTTAPEVVAAEPTVPVHVQPMGQPWDVEVSDDTSSRNTGPIQNVTK